MEHRLSILGLLYLQELTSSPPPSNQACTNL
jgi:hypothetical protein